MSPIPSLWFCLFSVVCVFPFSINAISYSAKKKKKNDGIGMEEEGRENDECIEKGSMERKKRKSD